MLALRYWDGHPVSWCSFLPPCDLGRFWWIRFLLPAPTSSLMTPHTQMKVLSIKPRGDLHAHYHTFGSGASCGIIKRVVVSATPTQCRSSK